LGWNKDEIKADYDNGFPLGMVKIVHDNYGKNPKKFVNRLE
jgi:hypothetical protein